MNKVLKSIHAIPFVIKHLILGDMDSDRIYRMYRWNYISKFQVWLLKLRIKK